MLLMMWRVLPVSSCHWSLRHPHSSYSRSTVGLAKGLPSVSAILERTIRRCPYILTLLGALVVEQIWPLEQHSYEVSADLIRLLGCLPLHKVGKTSQCSSR